MSQFGLWLLGTHNVIHPKVPLQKDSRYKGECPNREWRIIPNAAGLEQHFKLCFFFFFSCSLENCGITSDSCRDISAVLSNKSSLIDLSVGDNKIGDSGLALLCQGLLHPNCRIQKLW